MIEIPKRRQENSKTFKVGKNQERLRCHLGPIHYKDDYTDRYEGWKDTVLTWHNDEITKAPYILKRKGKLHTITNKKTGEISTVEVLGNSPDFQLVPDLTQVKFQHIAKVIPFEAKFNITGKGRFTYKAFDDDGEIELTTSLINGILTEKLSLVKDKHTSQVRLVKGNIRIDPTWQVGASTDDCWRRNDPAGFSLTEASVDAGGANADPIRGYGSGMRWTNVTIANSATVDTCTIDLVGKENLAGNTCNTRISAEDEDDPGTFDTAGNYDTSYANRTTARVDWDAIPAMVIDGDYTTPELSTIAQEIFNRGGWASGQAMVFFWEDYDHRSTTLASKPLRKGFSWNGDSTKAPVLDITISAWAGGDISGVAIGGVDKINGVSLSGVDKINGVA